MNNTKRLATIEAWDQELVTQGSVQLRNDARKLSLAFIGCVVFAFIGLVILLGDPSGGEIVFGGLAVLFFGVIGVPVLIWRIATGSPRVSVTREGVSVGNKTGVAWSDVEEVIGLKVNGARMLALRMRDSDTLDEAVQDSLTARPATRQQQDHRRIGLRHPHRTARKHGCPRFLVDVRPRTSGVTHGTAI